MEKLRVLQVGLSYKGGGIETFLINYTSNIDKEKVSIDFLNTFESSKQENFYKKLEKNGTIYNVSDYRKHPISFYKELKKLQLINHYDVMHYNMNSAVYLLPLIAAKKLGIKVIISHSHNSSSDKGFFKSIVHSFNKRIIPLFANTFFSCSELASKWFYSKKIRKSKKHYIINNAIDLDRFTFNEKIRKDKRKELKIADSTIVLGNIGRFEKQKNHNYLINIFYEYHKLNMNSKLILVGSGSLFEETKAKAELLGIKKDVLFLGRREDVNELYQAMDIFILPSIYEGLPLVGVEAQACGLPCIFSDTITTEVKLNNDVYYLPINEDYKKWSDTVNEIALINKDRTNTNVFKYEIKENTKRLLDIYEKERQEKNEKN